MLAVTYDGVALPSAAQTCGGNCEPVSAAAPTQVTVGTFWDVTGYIPTVISSSTAGALTITLADQYTNAITAALTGTAALTAAAGSLYCSDSATCAATAVTEPTANGFTATVQYEPQNPTTHDPLGYGTYDTISARLSVLTGVYAGNTYAGVSKTLEIGNLDGVAVPAVGHVIYDAPYAGAGNVEAGTPVELTATQLLPATSAHFNAYATEQTGVPMNFTLTAVTTTYTGTFSNGNSWIVVPTGAGGVASVNFTADKTAADEAAASIIASDPLTNVPSNTAPAAFDGDFTSGESTPTSLLVLASTYSGTGNCPEVTAAIATSYVATKGLLCINVLLSDAYGNSVQWTGSFALQITLATSVGSLSSTTVYITSLKGDTFLSGYPVEYTAPAAVGSATITASTTQPGISSGKDALSVVTINPLVSCVSKALVPCTTTFSSTGTYTATINGTAIPSPASAAGVSIVSFTYSLNGAAQVSAPLTAANSTGAGFTSFSVTLNQGSNTVKIYATDSAGNTGSATFTFTVTTAVVSPTTFTSTGAAQGTSAGFTGDTVTFTNTAGARSVNIFFVWYNSANQIVNIGAQLNVNFAASGSQTFFSAFTAPGTYTVQAFVRDTSNNAASTSYSATVTIP